MSKQIYFEDISEGQELPALPKIATTQMLVRWAGASLDFNPLHYEKDFAEMSMVGEPIVHGALKCAWLGAYIAGWAGEEGVLKKYTVQYRGMDYPRKMKSITECKDGETWQCKGKVVKKYTVEGENLVDCEIMIENGQGKVSTPGTATVALPSRK